MKIIKILLLIVIHPFLASTAFSQEKYELNHLEIKNIGYCKEKSGRPVENNFLFIQNAAVNKRTKEGHISLVIQSDSFQIKKYKKGEKLPFEAEEFYISSILSEIYSSSGIKAGFNVGVEEILNMDIELSFILLDEEIALFWKETFKNREYKQGILKIEREKLYRYCEGMGGSIRGFNKKRDVLI